MSFVWETTVISIIAFGILYWLLSKFAFGPLFGVMEKRRLLIEEQLNTAKQGQEDAVRNMAEQKEMLDKARKEAYDIIEQAKSTSGNQADEILASAKEEASRLKDNALRDIQSEKNKAVAALRNEVSGMSVLIASKIIEKQVDEKSQKELVDHYLKEVDKR
jgi:F-type H+-transporting ATPase subunit b